MASVEVSTAAGPGTTFSPDWRWPLGLAVASGTFHLCVFQFFAWRRHVPLEQMLLRWDAAHYATIALRGPTDGVLFAFYPLFPWLERLVVRLAAFRVGPQVAGAVLSGLFLVAGVLGIALLVPQDAASGRLLTPATRAGWFAFLFSPASWVFVTGLTEALFLLLSVLSFASAARRRGWTAGLFAAAACWTRNRLSGSG